jgi:hypothetical protein
MAHVEDLIRVLDAYRGRPYSTSAARFGPDVFDCSGYMVFGLRRIGFTNVPTVSSTQARWSYNAGLELSVPNGLRTRGAFLFMGRNRGLEGFGPDGHVALSLGDGVSTIETPAPGRVSGYHRRSPGSWSGAGRIPGLVYGAAPPPPPPPRPATVNGMLARNKDTGEIWLIGPGHAHHVPTTKAFNELRFVGVPYAGDMHPLVLIMWMQNFGAWDYGANRHKD